MTNIRWKDLTAITNPDWAEIMPLTDATAGNIDKRITLSVLRDKILGYSTPTLNSVFHSGNTITIIDTDNKSFSITNNDITNNPNTIVITNNTTGSGLFIDQNGNGYGINIDSENNVAINITCKNGLYITQNVTNGYGILVERNMAEVGTNPLVSINEYNASNTQTILSLFNSSSGRSLYIDHSSPSYGLYITRNNADAGTNALVFLKEDNSAGTQSVLYLQNDGTGVALLLYQNGNANGITINQTGSGNGITINQDNSGNGISIVSSSGTGILIDQNSNSYGIKIENAGTQDGIRIEDTNASSGSALRIDHDSTLNNALFIVAKYGIYLNQNISGGHGIEVVRDLSEAGSNPLIKFTEDNTASTQSVLRIQNDGTGNGLFIDQNGDGYGILVTQDGNFAGARFERTVKGVNSSHPVVYVESLASDENIGALLVACQDSTQTGYGIKINNSGIGDSLNITSSNYGNSINIAHTDNSVSACYGILMSIANAGTGKEYAFRFNGSEIISSAVGGSQDKKISVNVGGVDYYIPLHTA